MDGSVERVPAQVKILPPRRQKDGRNKRRFVVDGEARPPEPEEEARITPVERPLGEAPPDETGRRLDVSA